MINGLLIIVPSIPAGQDVAEQPHTFASVFCSLQLVDDELERPAHVWVGSIDKIEVVGLI
jgi:hypothetical protein